MTTEVTVHTLPGSPMECIKIEAMGELGPGGAYNQYNISGFNLLNNPNFVSNPSSREIDIHFQHGNPVPDGPNGITIETLLAICAHRLEGFQKGPYQNEKNAQAINKIYEALFALQSRELSFMKPCEEPAERVLDNEGNRTNEQWKDWPARFIRPEEVTVEVRVSADARQAGSVLVADTISKALRESGYENVLDLAEYVGDETPSVTIAESFGYDLCVEARGKEVADRIYATYKRVGIRVVRDYASMSKKARKPDETDRSKIVAAVKLLRANKHIWGSETNALLDKGQGFISYQTANSMRDDLRHVVMLGEQKNAIVAAVETVRGRTILGIEEVNEV